MIRYLRQNDGLLLIAIPTIFVLGSLVLLWASPHVHSSDLDIPLLQVLFPKWSFHLSPWVGWLINVPLVVITMILLNRAVQQLSLLGKLSNIPLLAIALIYFMIPQAASNPANWLSAILCVIFIQQAAKLLFGGDPKRACFNAGFTIGIMTLLSSSNLFFIFALIAVLLISGQFNIKRLLLSLIAVALPAYFLWIFAYTLGTGGHAHLYSTFDPSFSFLANLTDWNTVGFLSILSISVLIAHMETRMASTMRERKKWQFELAMFFCVFIAAFFSNPSGVAVVGAIPSAIIFSRVMAASRKKWLAALVLYGCIAVAAINQVTTLL